MEAPSMNNKRISEIFEEKPWQWGLRGDPFLWKEMADKIGELPLPDTERQLEELLHATFKNLVGFPISHRKDVLIERYAHGGMSSGYVSLRFWREKAIPMLLTRYSDT
jgi:hypothetical protein